MAKDAPQKLRQDLKWADACRLAGHQAGCPDGLLAGMTAGRTADRLDGLTTGWLAFRLADWRAGLLAGCRASMTDC
jgi:hypothetical protein